MMRIAAIDRNDGLLEVGSFGVLLDSDAFWNDVGNRRKRRRCGCQGQNQNCER